MSAKISDAVRSNKLSSIAVPIKLRARKKGDWIYIRLVAPGQPPVWVTNDPQSARFHKTLFRNLKDTMIAKSAWPFGQEDESGATSANVGLDRELEYFSSGESRYYPVLAKGGASASEILLRDRDRF